MKKFGLVSIVLVVMFSFLIGNPVLAESMSPVIQVDAGSFHNIALKSDGTVTAWGNEGWAGPTSAPEGIMGINSVAAGHRFSIVLMSDGTVSGWGEQNFSAWLPPQGLSNVTAITAGGRHSLALKQDGTVVGWGDNSDGQSTPPSGLKNVIKLAAGQEHSVAVKADGTVVAWGNNDYGQTDVPISLSNVKEVAAGDQFSLALKNDGTIVMWGAKTNSQEMQPPKGLSGIKAIAAGAFHAIALKNDGTVLQWGSSFTVQPPANLKNVTAVSAGRYHSIAILNDRTLITWGNDQSSIPVELRHKSANASLNSIVVESSIANLYPLFSKNIVDYRVDLPVNMKEIMIHTTAEDPNATINRYYQNGMAAPLLGIPLGNGPTIVDFVVTAEDGITVKKYRVTADQVLEYGQLQVINTDGKSLISLVSEHLMVPINNSTEIDLLRINLDKQPLLPSIDLIVPAELISQLKQKGSQGKIQIKTNESFSEISIAKLSSSEANLIQLHKKQLPTVRSFYFPGDQQFDKKYHIAKVNSGKKVHKVFKKDK